MPKPSIRQTVASLQERFAQAVNELEAISAAETTADEAYIDAKRATPDDLIVPPAFFHYFPMRGANTRNEPLFLTGDDVDRFLAPGYRRFVALSEERDDGKTCITTYTEAPSDEFMAWVRERAATARAVRATLNRLRKHFHKAQNAHTIAEERMDAVVHAIGRLPNDPDCLALKLRAFERECREFTPYFAGRIKLYFALAQSFAQVASAAAEPAPVNMAA